MGSFRGPDRSNMFVTAPRSQKVLSLGGFDPVDTLMDGLDWRTLRKLGVRQGAHDALDRLFLQQHSLCHENFMERVGPAFE